ncbi:MAG: TonB-dependent receptor [Phycisphaerales bacterium]|nr:TonB-dependent receptor [Phycisphaerales bacterium]
MEQRLTGNRTARGVRHRWTRTTVLETVAACVAAGLTVQPATAQTVEAAGDGEDFSVLDIEQLMQIEVTSVAGREQTLLDTPAAIHVLTADDIRRSGHRSIPEALRLVPGFTVGRISPSIWAIGSRGFADRFANDLLVLIDGRTVYDPLFSGTFWNVQDLMLEDLDRIEVIRGPGATLWGANAVNGVINITSKPAEDTLGLLLTGGVGSLDQGFGAVRYGGRIDERSAFRVFAKYDNHAAFDALSGGFDAGEWDMYRGGFRYDRVSDDDLRLTLQGDAYSTGHGEERVRVPVPGHLTSASASIDQDFRGANVRAKLGHAGGELDGWSVQAYYDRTEAHGGGQPGFVVERDTFDLDYRQYAPFGAEQSHVFMWGLGYRHSRDRTEASSTLGLLPRDRSLDTFAGFLQGTLELSPDELALMVGSKFEHNDYTGFEYQPSARLSWTPDDRQLVWGAVSRAVRTPSRTADDARLTTAFADTGLLAGGPASGMFVPLVVAGDPAVESEQLVAYELGYRVVLNDAINLDVATFYHDYEDLITLELPAGTFFNRGAADVYGVEVGSTWTVNDRWKLGASYAFRRIDVDAVTGTGDEDDTPQQQFNLQSYLDLSDDLELNTALYYVDTIPGQGVEASTRLDVGITWRPTPNVELAVWGQNLLDGRHVEFTDELFQDAALEVERSFYAQLTLRF